MAGNAGTSTRPAELRYLNTTGVSEAVFVGVDSASASDEYFTLDIDVKSPNCTPGDRVCSPNGVDINVCDSFGIFSAPFTCGGTCVNGSCTMPRGDFCFDAIPVNPLGGPVTFSEIDLDIDAQSNTMSLGPNSCLGPNGDGDGEEKFYSVVLAPGETVTAVMFDTFIEDMELYLITDCSQPVQTCVSGPELGGTDVTETQTYTNNTGATQTIIVVADFDDESARDEFSVTITVQ